MLDSETMWHDYADIMLPKIIDRLYNVLSHNDSEIMLATKLYLTKSWDIS